jgi:TP901 family phage tail tape measure protein
MVKRGTKAFDALQEKAREVGATTEFTAAEAGKGLEFLAMAGFDANQAMAALPLTVDLATASNLDLARASDIASDALGAFNMMSKDSAELTTNLTRINDVFAATVTSANVDMENLFETMKFAGPVMTTAGQSLETFAALTGKMGAAGIKGSLAGTALKNAVLNLQAPAGKTKAMVKKLGLTIADENGNMLDMIDILEQVEQKTKDMGTAQRGAAVEALFGKRAVAGVNVLLNEGGAELKRYRAELEASGGASKKMADEMRKSLGNRLAALKSAAIELGFKFIEAFETDGKSAIETLTEAIRNFDVKPAVEQAKEILGMMKKLFSFLWEHRDTIKTLIKLFIGWKIAMAGLGVARRISDFAALAKSLWKVVAGQKAMAAMGLRPGLPVGAAGPVQAGAKGGLLAAKTGDLARSAQGVVTMAGGALVAGFAGWKIGEWIESVITGPMNDAAQKVFDNATDAVTGTLEALRLKDPRLIQQSQKQVQDSTKKMTDSFLGVPKVLITTEAGFGTVGAVLNNIVARFSDDVDTVQTPIAKWVGQMEALKLSSIALEIAMRNAARQNPAGPNGGKSTIDVDFSNTPAGTTIKTKSTPGAPALNTSQQGANL